jgi:hypothetical protein
LVTGTLVSDLTEGLRDFVDGFATAGFFAADRAAGVFTFLATALGAAAFAGTRFFGAGFACDRAAGAARRVVLAGFFGAATARAGLAAAFRRTAALPAPADFFPTGLAAVLLDFVVFFAISVIYLVTWRPGVIA